MWLKTVSPQAQYYSTQSLSCDLTGTHIVSCTVPNVYPCLVSHSHNLLCYSMRGSEGVCGYARLKAGSQYDDRVSFRSFRIVPFGRLMFELFTNYRSLVPFPSLQFTLC